MTTQLELLLELQHIDYMIKDWENSELRKKFKEIGFKTKGKDPIELLLKKKQQVIKKIEPKLYNHYQLVMQRYRDWAVVPVLGGFCGGCFEKVPTELSGQKYEVITCPNCGRFLYWE